MFRSKFSKKFYSKRPIPFIVLGTILLALVALGLPAFWPSLPSIPGDGYEGVILSAAADPYLKRACFDCHSNSTRWPWYARMPLVGMILKNGVSEGRSELNFSQWNRISPKKRRKALKESMETIRSGEMPPWGYRLMHPEARLNEAETGTLLAVLRTAGGGGSFHHGDREEDERDEEDD